MVLIQDVLLGMVLVQDVLLGIVLGVVGVPDLLFDRFRGHFYVGVGDAIFYSASFRLLFEDALIIY